MKAKKFIISALTLLIAFGLAACGNNSESSSKSNDSQSASNSAVYALSSAIYYDSNGKVTSETKNEYNDKGNLVKQHIVSQSESGDKIEATIVTDDFNDEGYPQKSTRVDLNETAEVSYAIENGHAIETKVNSITSITSTYYPNGAMQSQTNYGKNGKDLLRVVEYDENGYTTKMTNYGDTTSNLTYEWSFDDNGYAKGCEIKASSPDAPTTMSYSLAVECDEHGNIIRMLRDGKLYADLSYVKIENPSVNTWVESQKKPR